MKIRVKDNLWTHAEWWDQLAKTDYNVVLKKIEENKPEIIFSLTRLRSQEKLVNLLDDIHTAVINEIKLFDVQSWLNRAKKRQQASEK